MHFRSLVTIPKEVAETSLEARRHASNYLEDNGFNAQGGRFSNSPSDWFVIGGRWSGLLNAISPEFEKAVKVIFPKDFITTDDIRSRADDLQAEWERLGGKDLNPMSRNSYETFGYDDDASILTEELYNRFLKGYEGKGDDGEFVEEYAHKWIDTEYRALTPELINNSWIVLLDYHN